VRSKSDKTLAANVYRGKTKGPYQLIFFCILSRKAALNDRKIVPV